jgi:hypothetical protein
MASTKSKVDYWFFFTMKMGVKKGHLPKTKKKEWWLFYSNKGEIVKKVEYKIM